MYTLTNGLYLPGKSAVEKNDDSFNARVLIRRNSDREVVEYTGDGAKNTTIYQWAAGNYSCDCNRDIFFEGEMYDDTKCGETQYSIQMYDADTGELVWDEFTVRESYY